MSDNAVAIAIRKVLETYALIHGDDRADAHRECVVDYLNQRFAAGESDNTRLAVAALTFLREKDGDASKL